MPIDSASRPGGASGTASDSPASARAPTSPPVAAPARNPRAIPAPSVLCVRPVLTPVALWPIYSGRFFRGNRPFFWPQGASMILLIDNYDSFTWNLVHYMGEAGAEVVVRRNDQITVDEALAMAPDGIVISPGPCDPAQAGICLDLIRAAADRAVPLFGVCLGHQAIGGVRRSRRARQPHPAWQGRRDQP